MRKRSRNRKWKIRVILYVDNLLMHGNNSAMLSSFKEYLGSCFRMKDFRNLTYFSCLKVTRNVECILLFKECIFLFKTIPHKLFVEICFLSSRPAHFLMEQNFDLAKDTSPFLANQVQYHCLLDRFIYFSYHSARFILLGLIFFRNSYTRCKSHWEVVLRVVHFLKATIGLMYLVSFR